MTGSGDRSLRTDGGTCNSGIDQYEYRAVCENGHSSPWYSDRSLALEWKDGHNGGLDPDGIHRTPCGDGHAQIEKRSVDTGIDHGGDAR